MSKERFFKGTFLLTSAGLISRIMGFFYRIFLSHTIGAEGIGLSRRFYAYTDKKAAR